MAKSRQGTVMVNATNEETLGTYSAGEKGATGDSFCLAVILLG